jgi:hypothetical protein
MWESSMVNSEHWLHCNGETDLIKKKLDTVNAIALAKHYLPVFLTLATRFIAETKIAHLELT